MDWDVGNGGEVAVILETGTTTATGRSSITVRYDVASTTSAESGAVSVEATSGGETKAMERTVFSVDCSLKFAGALNNANDLEFPSQEAAGRFGLVLHAYCLMASHYHLLLQPSMMRHQLSEALK